MSDSPDDRELADDAEALARELRELRTALERRGPRPPRGPLGLPRPPTPREFMEFADEVAIPATIAILETNIKLLEALQRAIRLAEGGRRARERGREASDSARSRVESVSRETLTRVSDALTDLQSVLEGTELPENETAAGILEEARSLREEIQREIGASRREDHSLDEFTRTSGDRDGADAADVQDRTADRADDGGAADDEDDEPVEIDVDAELETLKERYGTDEDDESVAEDDGQEAGDSGADDDASADGADGEDDDSPAGTASSP
ncbi:DUF7547 family protein [Haloarchaeobius amylolyticus]|uniref:DUF7547 family protein n=1 Tax=Haloarchaeobius amylolyticus TaxID=1198296 RepID=UPI00226E43F1|nr:hypothetical protein [Haloarchaeobius amylolyticus]